MFWAAKARVASTPGRKFSMSCAPDNCRSDQPAELRQFGRRSSSADSTRVPALEAPTESAHREARSSHDPSASRASAPRTRCRLPRVRFGAAGAINFSPAWTSRFRILRDTRLLLLRKREDPPRSGPKQSFRYPCENGRGDRGWRGAVASRRWNRPSKRLTSLESGVY